MPRIYPYLLVLAVSVPLLGGCALFSPKQLAKQSKDWVPDARDPAEYAQSQMALAREALQLEQYGLAIICFRNVQRFPEHAAAAHNGLGVVFAKIGRFDLARRYFALAAEQDPADTRFAANLARLDTAVAERQAANLAQAAVAAPIRAARTSQPGPITVHQPDTTIVRVSSNSVSIITAQPSRAPEPVRASSGRALAAADPAGRRRNPEYPARIWFGGNAARTAMATTE